MEPWARMASMSVVGKGVLGPEPIELFDGGAFAGVRFVLPKIAQRVAGGGQGRVHPRVEGGRPARGCAAGQALRVGHEGRCFGGKRRRWWEQDAAGKNRECEQENAAVAG